MKLTYSRDLLVALVLRDMKLRYQKSVLGLAWSLLNPLAQLLVFNFVFATILRLNVPHYVSFLFSGLLAWTWFQSSVNAGTASVVDNRELIKRPGFPAPILPLVAVTTQFVHFLLAFPILLVFLALSGITISGAIVTLPLLFAIQFMFTLSLAYFASTIHVRFRDTQYLLGIFLMLGFYLSPILYDAQAIPPRFQMVYHLNPMTILIELYRTILINQQFPAGTEAVPLGAACVGLLAVSYIVFKRASRHFVEEL
jgi:lipopolysaccharide transport system permease protein